MVDEADVARWVAAVKRHPERYRLPAYGPYITPERIAGYFTQWYADEAAGQPRPALCRRCGRLLREAFRPYQQLHLACEPPQP